MLLATQKASKVAFNSAAALLAVQQYKCSPRKKS
jgi:hypothetical protein